MRLFSFDVAVGIVPASVFKFVPANLNSVAFQAVGAVELGVSGVTIGTGYPVAAGGSFGFNREDFDSSQYAPVDIYAVAASATELRVFGFER